MLQRRDAVLEQYRDSSNYAARVELHSRYSSNPTPFPVFAFDRVVAAARERVLEVGCGPGWLWRLNARRVPARWRVVISDLSHGMVSEARGHLGLEAVVVDSMALPFATGSFDTVVANHMLYHLPDLDAALEEFVRVLEPGGTLVAATNGERHFTELRGLLPSGARWTGHIHAFGLETGPPALARHFTDVTVERHPSTLEVPETEPIVRYVASMPSSRITGAVLEALRGHVEEVVSRDGVFRITADAGVITARRP